MRLGSWRSVQIRSVARIAALLSAAWLVAGIWYLGFAEPEVLAVSLLAPILIGGSAAAILHKSGESMASNGPEVEVPHRGPNVSRIRLAGLPGLAFAIGYVVMFWGGVPAYRPIVVAVGVLGGIGGALLVYARRKSRPPSATPLGLKERVCPRTTSPPCRDAGRSGSSRHW